MVGYVSSHNILICWKQYEYIISTYGVKNSQKSLKHYHRNSRHPINWSILPNQKMLIIKNGENTETLPKLILRIKWEKLFPKNFGGIEKY